MFNTLSFERTVLVVARNQHTTEWLLDFLPDVLDDPRIQIVFTIDEVAPSAFQHGARELIRAIDSPLIPWSQALSIDLDLAITATFTASGLDQLRCPLMVMVHGPGIGKAGTVPNDRIPVPLRRGTGSGRTTVVLPHEAERGLFQRRPDGVDLVVAGDPCLDRMTVSHRLRPLFRHRMGLVEHQKLIVMCSTWGERAQLAAVPELSATLANQLPVDEYRIAMVVHPHIWQAHSGWQVRSWLREATLAGVHLVPPESDSWRGSLVAADLALVDHGSVGVYAAAIGTPILQIGLDHSAVQQGSALAILASDTESLTLDAGLRTQIDDAIASQRPSNQAVAARISSKPGRALQLLRSEIYAQLSLEPRPRPVVTRSVGVPEVRFEEQTAHTVLASIVSSDPDRPTYYFQRFTTPPPPRTHRQARTQRAEAPRRRSSAPRPTPVAERGRDHHHRTWLGVHTPASPRAAR